jgi:hypothetical protein
VAKQLPLYVLPVTIGMSDNDLQQFNAGLRTYVEKERSLMNEE